MNISVFWIYYGRRNSRRVDVEAGGSAAPRCDCVRIYGSNPASAPAAYDTLHAFFSDTKTTPADYDAIFTGDLGALGHEIVTDFFHRDGIDLSKNYYDCGLLLYDRSKQDMHAGASGCGCSAAVLNGYLLTELRRGTWKRILFAPTGALLSPTSSFQGESIPGICHVVCLSNQR